MFRKLLLCFLFFLGKNVYASEQGCTNVDISRYAGGFYGKFTWLYLLPTVSDGDLQFGTALTLTGPPLTIDETQNLNAHVLQIDPDYTSAYRWNIGYVLPCTNSNIDLEYFYFRASDSDSATSPIRNAQTYQFLQNFLGGGFVSANADDTQRIDHADLSYGKQYIIDHCLNIHPYLGVSFAYIKRNLDVTLLDFVVPPIIAPIPARLVGSLRSRYWGFGPTIGTDFSFPLFPCIEFSGHFGITALAGHVSSEINSTSVRGALVQNFSARDSSYRMTPVVRSDLGLTYTRPICQNKLAFDLSVGYQVDYYFRVVDRVNPDNGYVNNPNSFPTTTTSSMGLGGPYAQIALTTASLPCCTENLLYTTCFDQNRACGFYLSIENSWLKPCPTDKDLTYAIFRFADGSSEDQKIVPDYSWSGSYHLGYHFPCNFDLEACYRYFQNEGSDSVTAGALEGISSLNASGPADVLFSNASSRVKYRLHQLDLLAGKYARLCNPFDLYGFAGLRYLNLERTLHNAFLGGVPSDLTQSKFPILNSDYWGIGPIMGIKPSYFLCKNIGFTGLFDVALLVGNSNSRLDQVNFGTVLGETSNTLRTRDIQTIVPVIDTKVGVFWTFELCHCIRFNLEAGYLFSDYFRAVNLVFPNFLTGLGQNNSSLLLSGPYFTLEISGF